MNPGGGAARRIVSATLEKAAVERRPEEERWKGWRIIACTYLG